MIKLEVILPKNEVMAVSEGLKKINVGGLTVSKKRGRGKNPASEIHASKGTEIFVPQFSDKYVLEIIIPENMEQEAIKIIRENATIGKIFVHPVLRAFDIKSGNEGEKAI
ncbi:MAG TPA: P-II family nitrogen regulator [Candidatus Nitrosotenuis sp.]|nr:P-II family nitrogen regulator [Candidatus Nitrosotenuis sp.]